MVNLFDDFEAEFFDDRVGEDFFGHAFGLRLRVFAGEAVEVDDEEFALADVLDGVVAEPGEGVLNGLALGIENGALRHDPNVCFHAGDFSRDQRPETRDQRLSPKAGFRKPALQRPCRMDGGER